MEKNKKKWDGPYNPLHSLVSIMLEFLSLIELEPKEPALKLL